jgi:hypothetical protein
MLDLDGGRACWIVGILLEQCDMWLWCLKKCLTEESDLCWWVLFIEVLKEAKNLPIRAVLQPNEEKKKIENQDQ